MNSVIIGAGLAAARAIEASHGLAAADIQGWPRTFLPRFLMGSTVGMLVGPFEVVSHLFGMRTGHVAMIGHDKSRPVRGCAQPKKLLDDVLPFCHATGRVNGRPGDCLQADGRADEDWTGVWIRKYRRFGAIEGIENFRFGSAILN